MQPIFRCSFPDPSSSHRGRPSCPPTRNGSAACWRWTRSLPPAESDRRACDAGRGAGQETGGPRATAAQAACRGGVDCRLGAGHGEERT
eukprot:scaffold24778_cov48-Phaeocystis_antarctica.AAC.1